MKTLPLTELLKKITPLTVEDDGSGLIDRRGCSLGMEDYQAVAAAANVLLELVDELNRLRDLVGEVDVKIIDEVLARVEEVKSE